ncbi:MAG: EAL domain-containing protein [Alphaproteobacteria bacterium]|nr:EAL domain-containing protein [Alphaproteobacteria bacterium]
MYAGSYTSRNVEAGEVICREGEPGDCAFLIEQGAVEIMVTRHGAPVSVGRLGPGDMFGEMSMIDDSPRSATAVAREHCRLIVVTNDQLVRRVAQTDPVLRMCLTALTQRLRAATARIAPQGGARHALAQSVEPQQQVKEHAMRQLLLEQELRDGIRHQAFAPHYQPIVSLDDGSVVGYEALVRWQHAERGILGPGAFLSAAEASGLIVPIDRQVRHRALGFLAREDAKARRYGARAPYMSINVAAQDFMEPDFVDEIARAIGESAVAPQSIMLELTETCIIADPALVAAKLAACKRIGVRVAIDDFGTGYSSLSYLHQFPIDAIKIDRSFVQAIEHDERRGAVILLILQLAAELGFSVIAEGIETAAHVALLGDIGCRLGQGYYYGRPQPEASLEASKAA